VLVPNLSASPFLNRRQVVLTGAALALVATVLTAVNIGEVVSARGRERAAAGRLVELDARRQHLAAEVRDLDRQLGAVGWRRLEFEATSLREVVARRQFAWSQLLSDLERMLPWNVRLISIDPRFEKNGSIGLHLSGLATDREAWLHLLAVLFADPRFSDPVPESEEEPGGRSPQGHSFALSVSYWPEGRR
jgi:Tfp pilus assembly protein PilN